MEALVAGGPGDPAGWGQAVTRRLAQRTQLGPWSRGQSDEAACEDDECGWSEGPGKSRVIEYAARRHVVATGHVVEQWRTFSRVVFLADDEPAP